MIRVRYLLQISAFIFAATLLTIWPALSGADTARADEEETHAGMVIFFDDGDVDYLLFELDVDADITAMDLLIERDYELEIAPFGGLGEAVCSINETGCPGSDCFCESFSSPAYFWQFFQWDGQQWVPQHQGASQHIVEPGEIVGWSWTATPPGLPDVSFDDFLTAEEPEATTAPQTDEIVLTPDSTPADATSETEMSDDGALDDDQDASSSGLECLQFISIVTIAAGLTGIFARRRYGARVLT